MRYSILIPLTLSSLLCADLVAAQGQMSQPSNYDSIKMAHAILACVAWVVFFPLGSIMIRILSSPKTWLVHALMQTFAYSLFIVAVGLGIWMAKTTDQLNSYHPIIGLVLFGLVFFQPIGGLIHHYLYRRGKKSTIVALTHVWLGRILITLGMINGGLGLLLSGDSSTDERIAYGVIAGVIWVTYILVVLVAERRGKEAPEVTKG